MTVAQVVQPDHRQSSFVFATRDAGSSSWGLEVVERIGAGNEPPWLIDTQMLGVFYGGTMQFGADPNTGFKKNLTTLSVEVKTLFHVRNPDGHTGSPRCENPAGRQC